MCATHEIKADNPLLEIRSGTPDDIDVLCEIDLDASRLFEHAGLNLDLPNDHEFFHRERNRWIESLAAGGTVLAVSREGRVLGFAASGLRDNEPYLDQLSVRTQFMRRGIGASLLNAVQRQAIHAGGRVLWLTTYGHLPWNRPFYERAGFAVIDESRWGPQIRNESSYERRWLPCPQHRIVMRKELARVN